MVSFDGLHYYQMNDENSALIKFEYATGTFRHSFQHKKVCQCTFDTFEGFWLVLTKIE